MSIRAGAASALFGALLLAGCGGNATPKPDRDIPSAAFPAAHRPVAPIVSSRWSTEEARDRLKEADRVMDLAGVKPGMTVADIGAGEGYYTIRLAQRVGAKGRVLAEDIIPEVRNTLAERVYREQLDNVSVRLGEPADPKLPDRSFDRILMVHMYHEIEAPYEFLWRMRPSLKEGGRVIIVDADRPTANHGTPPALLACELAAVGYRQTEARALPQQGTYLRAFEPVGKRPAPEAIAVCKG
ncbi:MAG: class I SAM-dependent methyltransferase [Sphingomonadales bacterium]|nr:class I SAM-dependent methyltransferase [Sphingomonadales bacterium]